MKNILAKKLFIFLILTSAISCNWKIRVLKKGYAGGLLALAKSFGIDAEYSTK